MKTLFTFGLGALLLFFLAACSAVPAPRSTDFSVRLSYTETEVGEDGHSTTRRLFIEDDKFTYSSGDWEESFILVEDKLQAITLLIRENGLMVSREATISSGNPLKSFDITWDFILQGQSSIGHLIGEPGEAGEVMGETPLPDEGVFAVETLFDYIEDEVL
ncbi:MAG: hypothetical protein WC777_01965 [Candidatus Gracilibacteria bacterium]|jgi:hypothetical protein